MATATRRRPRIARATMLPVPKLADGWSRECRHVVRYANLTFLDSYSPGDLLPESPAPPLGDLLLGASDLAFRRDDLSAADVLIALRSAMLFVGIE